MFYLRRSIWDMRSPAGTHESSPPRFAAKMQGLEKLTGEPSGGKNVPPPDQVPQGRLNPSQFIPVGQNFLIRDCATFSDQSSLTRLFFEGCFRCLLKRIFILEGRACNAASNICTKCKGRKGASAAMQRRLPMLPSSETDQAT